MTHYYVQVTDIKDGQIKPEIMSEEWQKITHLYVVDKKNFTHVNAEQFPPNLIGVSFAGCTKLESIVVSSNTVEILDFNGCAGLKHLDIKGCVNLKIDDKLQKQLGSLKSKGCEIILPNTREIPSTAARRASGTNVAPERNADINRG